MHRFGRASRRIAQHALSVAVVAAAFAGGPAAASATTSIGPAPTYEELQETARTLGIENVRPGLAPTYDEIQETARNLRAPSETASSVLSDSGGFPSQAVMIGGSIGAGIGLALAALALLAGRRRGQPVGS